MSAQTETQTSSFDGIKWVVAIALLAAAVVGNYYYGEQVSILYRAIGVVILVAVAGIVAGMTDKGRRFRAFAKESRTEVRRVVWPTRQETTQTTLIILVATAIVLLILWGMDAILVRVVGFFTGLEF
ncbi:preprotein translocase subunit SecE [Pseudidiomarina aestuarii]|uniref:Protein translocase subunit SecE n=1 Tax=Pseudidiomarina aestuarii TaxID=624146 RepID=A0A2T4CN41_9GAMM|nr:preprotein translocase subunit SecE [Pseudidiomarina aestuarii]